MTFDPRETLATVVDELPDAKYIPSGHYVGQIMGHSWGPNPFNRNSDEQALLFKCQLIEPGDDVDAEAVAATEINLRELNLRDIAYPFLPDRIPDIKKLLQSLGLGSLPMEQGIVEATGKRVLLTVNAQPSKRAGDDRVYNNITHMVGLSE